MCLFGFRFVDLGVIDVLEWSMMHAEDDQSKSMSYNKFYYGFMMKE